MEATFRFIGHINTPYAVIEDCPDNVDLNGPVCQLVIHDEFIEAAVLPIESIDNGVVSVKGLDCLSGTHLLDIKPAILHEENT